MTKRETGAEEVGFEMCPKTYSRETISYLEGERVLKIWSIMTERIRGVFN